MPSVFQSYTTLYYFDNITFKEGVIEPKKRKQSTETNEQKKQLEQPQAIERDLSKRSKNKIRNKVLAWLDSTETKALNFITLTIDKQLHEDKIYAKALNKFFTSTIKHYGKLSYLWVAETQENGNLHFHIIFNKYLDWQRLNYYWAKQLVNLGHDIKLPKKYIENNQIKFNSKDSFNGLHGEGIYLNKETLNNADKVAIYISKATKYITKGNEDRRKPTCSLWYCTRDISNLATTQTKDYTFKELQDIQKSQSFTNNKGEVVKSEWQKITLDDGRIINYLRIFKPSTINNRVISKYNKQKIAEGASTSVDVEGITPHKNTMCLSTP